MIALIPGALLGLGFGFAIGAHFDIFSGGLVSMPIPHRHWPFVTMFAISASLLGALVAIPKQFVRACPRRSRTAIVQPASRNRGRS
jgi:hypothetical protein